MKTSQKGIHLITEFEGFEPEAYLCPAGVWTVGYGTTQGVTPTMKVTREQAIAMLKRDVEFAEEAIDRLVKVPITQGQFDALVSFIYNLGEGAFEESNLLRLLNEGKYAEAGDRLLRYTKADGVELEGLKRRREAERKLYYSQPFTGGDRQC